MRLSSLATCRESANAGTIATTEGSTSSSAARFLFICITSSKSKWRIELSTTEDTEDAEQPLPVLCVLRVLRGGEFHSPLNVSRNIPAGRIASIRPAFDAPCDGYGV